MTIDRGVRQKTWCARMAWVDVIRFCSDSGSRVSCFNNPFFFFRQKSTKNAGKFKQPNQENVATYVGTTVSRMAGKGTFFSAERPVRWSSIVASISDLKAWASREIGARCGRSWICHLPSSTSGRPSGIGHRASITAVRHGERITPHSRSSANVAQPHRDRARRSGYTSPSHFRTSLPGCSWRDAQGVPVPVKAPCSHKECDCAVDVWVCARWRSEPVARWAPVIQKRHLLSSDGGERRQCL